MASRKCQRCGEDESWQEGRPMRKASGPDAIIRLTLKGLRGTLIAEVCGQCASQLRKLGWQ